MIFDIGPITLYRAADGTLDISLKFMKDRACGWEWGWRDDMRGDDHPIVQFRIGKLNILYLEFYEGGCEVWFMGFWAFPSWGKGE